MCEFPILLVVARVKFEIHHEILRNQVALCKFVLILPVFALGTVTAGGGGNIVLDDIAQTDAGQGVFVLDTALDVYQPLFKGIVSLRGIGEQVFEYFTVVAVLEKGNRISCFCHVL